MKTFKSRNTCLEKNNKGQSLIEYALILAFLVVLCLSVISVLHDGLRYTFLAFIIQRQSTPSSLPAIGGEFQAKPPTIDYGNQPPVAGITTVPFPPKIRSGDVITFSSASYDPDAGDTIASFRWDFGDGSAIQTGPVVTHIYTTSETYEIWSPRLTIKDSHGASASATTSVGAVSDGTALSGLNLPPTAVFDAAPISGPAPLTVTFTSTSSDSDGSIVKYQWHFGDVSIIGSGEINVHVYDTPGEYEAKLTVTDDGGETAESDRVFITVEEPPPPNVLPTISIRSSVTDGFTGTGIDFITDSAQDSDGSVEYYEWDFGDGSPTVGPHIISSGIPIVPHTYTSAGNFTASLTVWDNDGASVTETVNVSIIERTCDHSYIKRQIWNGIPGTSVSDLTSLAAFPLSPDLSEDLLTLQEPPGSSGDDYGARYLGYILPPATGSYIFYISSDDSSDFYLSSNDSPSNMTRIAYVSGWTSSLVWDKYSSQQSAAISLTAGQKYYFEIRHKEGTGGDGMAAAWVQPGGSSTPEILTSDYLCFDDTLVPPAPTATPTPVPAPTATPAPGGCRYEAESANLSNVSIVYNHGGYSGSGFVDYPGPISADNYIEWDINVTLAGNYDLGFRYALSSGNRPLELNVNGAVAVASLSFPSTGAWSSWGMVNQVVPLNAGPNTIRLSAGPSNGANIDCLAVDPQ
jgi:PKD repeat protein/Flp pilus assembly pilin Flp